MELGDFKPSLSMFKKENKTDTDEIKTGSSFQLPRVSYAFI